MSSPGYLDGTPGARERAGLPANTGPFKVITQEAMFDFHEETRQMRLIAMMPWTSVEQVLSKMEFEPLIADKIDAWSRHRRGLRTSRQLPWQPG
jgi:acyl CoA:acetate/3-ketoacid CoA transferase beta subunit